MERFGQQLYGTNDNNKTKKTIIGTKFPFIMKLCFSSSKSMNNAWNIETIEKMNEDN